MPHARSRPLSYRLFAAAAVAALALQGCAPKPAQQVFSADDLTDGAAKTCSFSPAQPNPGATVSSTITMTNDGWCAYRASEKPGSAYLLGLVKQRPLHGEVLVRKWAGESRAEYNPEPRFVGTDKFTVAFRPEAGGADALVRITANVTQGAGMPATAEPAAEPEKKPTTTRRRAPARRRTTTR